MQHDYCNQESSKTWWQHTQPQFWEPSRRVEEHHVCILKLLHNKQNIIEIERRGLIFDCVEMRNSTAPFPIVKECNCCTTSNDPSSIHIINTLLRVNKSIASIASPSYTKQAIIKFKPLYSSLTLHQTPSDTFQVEPRFSSFVSILLSAHTDTTISFTGTPTLHSFELVSHSFAEF